MIGGFRMKKFFFCTRADPIFLDKRSPLLFFLQRIRDEAHRMAIGFHRKTQKKSTLQSALDDIPGIGPAKKKRLLTKFGSPKRDHDASDDELLQVKGITSRDLTNLRKTT